LVVINGTVIPVDRVAAGRPFYSGKHHRHYATRLRTQAAEDSARPFCGCQGGSGGMRFMGC
jgi:hypothetical protein